MKKSVLVILFSIFILTISACNNSNEGVFSSYPNNTIAVGSDEDNNTFVYNREGKIIKEFSGEYIYDVHYNLKCNVVVLELDETAYIISNDKVKQIKREIEDLVISDSGNTVFYKFKDDKYDMYLEAYDVSSGKAQIIDKSEEGYFYELCVSPDGKTFAYYHDGIEETFISVNGKKPVSLGKEISPIAVANEGKLIYGWDNDYNFIVMNGSTTNILSTASIDIFFNRDYSEVLVFGDEISISVNGAKTTTLLKERQYYPYVLVAEGTFYDTLKPGSSDSYVVYGLDSFLDKYIFFDDSYDDKLYYINKDLKAIEVCDSVYDHGVTNSNELFYSKYDSINKCVKEKSDIILETKSSSLMIPRNSDGFYYISSGDLYYKKNGKEASLITDNSILDMEISGDIVYYLLEEEDGKNVLYYSKNGEVGKKVKNGENVESIKSYHGNMIYFLKQTDEQWDLYLNTSDDRIDLVIKNYD